jgi:putative SOS response-associated peptidase YedK
MRHEPPLSRLWRCATCNPRPGTSKRSVACFVYRTIVRRQFQQQPAIFPCWYGSVIRKAEEGERELVTMSWGFVLLQPGKAPRRVTNVRDDKILSSRFWKPSFEQRRCLVTASSYCEPDSGKPAKWHSFAVNGDEDRRLSLFLASGSAGMAR